MLLLQLSYWNTPGGQVNVVNEYLHPSFFGKLRILDTFFFLKSVDCLQCHETGLYLNGIYGGNDEDHCILIREISFSDIHAEIEWKQRLDSCLYLFYTLNEKKVFNKDSLYSQHHYTRKYYTLSRQYTGLSANVSVLTYIITTSSFKKAFSIYTE